MELKELRENTASIIILRQDEQYLYTRICIRDENLNWLMQEKRIDKNDFKEI